MISCKHIGIVLILLIASAGSSSVYGQLLPPTPISVSGVQNLSFGIFGETSDAGGTLTVSNSGVRSSTGSIVLIGSGGTYCSFNITAATGTQLILYTGTTVTLTGSNGGTMSLQLGTPSPIFPYTTISGTTLVKIGGTLTVGSRASNPPGDYSGSFSIIFNNE